MPRHKKQNPNSIKALEENRAATQFDGEKANPRYTDIPNAPQPYSIRHAYSRLCALNSPDLSDKTIEGLVGRPLNWGEKIAIAMMRRAAKGEINAVEKITENIDGRLEEFVNLNHTGALATATANSPKKLAELDEAEAAECHRDILNYALKHYPNHFNKGDVDVS